MHANNDTEIDKERKYLINSDENNPRKNFYYDSLNPIKTTIKLSKMNTLNILYYLEESFKSNNKVVMENLKRIQVELKNRRDLFESALKFLQNQNVKDDLFYYIPGDKCKFKQGKFYFNTVPNVFSVISQVIPDFILKYKQYFIESVVANKEFYDVFHFIQQRYLPEMKQFTLMKKDLSLFKNVISYQLWTDNEEFKGPNKKNCMLLNIVPEFPINEDLNAFLVEEISQVDFNIGDLNIIVPLSHFNGLTTKDTQYKQFWIEKGIVDSDWNFQV